YKRLDVAIRACRQIGVPLTIVGRGPEQFRLEALGGDAVRFLGWLGDEQIRDLYSRATAVLLPGIEDFGMVPVEAQACGCPVVALGIGGACETVLDGVTGTLADDGSVDAFAEALERCRQTRFDRDAIRANALRFSREHFRSGFQAAVADALNAGSHG